MPLAEHLVEPDVFALPWSCEPQPLALIDLDRAAPSDDLVLPPFPVLGIGNRHHPLASRLDAMIEPPVAPEAIVGQILAQPLAAGVIVQLLRLGESMPLDAALVAESMAYGLLQGSAGHAAWLAVRQASEAPAGEVAIVRRGGLLEIVLCRPEAGNAIDRPMRDGLRQAFELAAFDRSIEQVVLRGAGRTFSLGADLAEFGTTGDPATAHAIRMRTLPAEAIARCAGKLRVHVDGACVGAGLEMAAFAARVTATSRSWFQLPELAMGLLAGAGGCVSLSRRIGRQRTALLLLSGRRIGARTAVAWGLVDALVDHGASDDGEADIIGQQP